MRLVKGEFALKFATPVGKRISRSSASCRCTRPSYRPAEIGPTARRRVAIDRTFQAVAEIVTDAVVSADSHGAIIYVNKGGERLFGWDAQQLAGRPVTVLLPER